MELIDPMEFAMSLGFHPDERQAEVLRSGAKRLLMLCTRQWGKSTIAALLGLHGALFWPGSTTLICSRSWRQSSELFRKIAAWIVQVNIGVQDLSRLQCTLDNGSRIISLPGEEATIRGYTADRVIIDEASRTDDLLLAALRPMLATTEGTLIALSTPAGCRGWFYEAWMSRESWYRLKVTAPEIPDRISPEFLESERVGLPSWLYEQEYLAEFIEGAGAVFGSEFIEAAKAAGKDLEPLFPELLGAMG